MTFVQHKIRHMIISGEMLNTILSYDHLKTKIWIQSDTKKTFAKMYQPLPPSPEQLFLFGFQDVLFVYG